MTEKNTRFEEQKRHRWMYFAKRTHYCKWCNSLLVLGNIEDDFYTDVERLNLSLCKDCYAMCSSSFKEKIKEWLTELLAEKSNK